MVTERDIPANLDKQVFEKLFKTFFPSLILFARKYLPDLDTAKEIVHNVFLNLWEKRETIDASKLLKSYLFTSVHNRCLNYIRDQKKFSRDEHLTTFIRVGEIGAEIVEHVIWAISTYKINKPMILTYESEDDGEVKTLEVIENPEFDGVTWEFQLTITDVESEGNDDGGSGLQIFWNRKPVKGIALIKPANLDRVHDNYQGNAMFRIDYSEGGEYEYDAHMTVSAANLPVPPAFADPYGMKTLKMFAGKKGDIIDVFGNSDYPNAYFFSNEIGVGFNWAFVAAGDKTKDIGVAEVGLPRNDLDQPSRSVLLEDYSVKNVLTEAILAWNPSLPPTLVNAYLANTEAPGYFDTFGFVSAGERPDEDYAELDVRLPDMSPYNPKAIRDLTISFKAD